MAFFTYFSRFALFIFLFATLHLNAQIIEIDSFSKLEQYVTREGTLLLVDIDDTCLIPTQALGTDVWFIATMRDLEHSGLSKKQALAKALLKWQAVRQLTKVKLVEEGSDEVLRKIQESGICVMGLTTQGMSLTSCTSHQLESLNINFNLTSPSKKEFHFLNTCGEGVLYKHGILFTSGSEKASALEKFFYMTGYFPKEIVFINDKATHLADAENVAKTLNIPFTGLRYSYSDDRVNNYNHEITQIQLKHSSLVHILSDEEAELILNNQNSLESDN